MVDSMFVFENKVRVKPVDRTFSTQTESASLFIRYIALMIDTFFIVSILLFSEIFLGAAAVQARGNIFNIFIGHLLYWGIPAQIITYIYYCCFYLTFGASPGKMAFGIRVVSADTGGNLSLMQIFIREILGKFFSLFFFGFGFVLAFFREDRRALHDLIGSSRVVVAPQKIPQGL